MAEWKKVVVSGSGVAQLSNDANYLIDAQDSAILTGSFTGSFSGDGSGLTGVTADGTISGSVQVTVQDTTGFSGLQANISSSITDLSSSVDAHLDANISALSASSDSHLDSEISLISASAHADRINKISILSASVDTHLDANITALSSSAQVKREAISSSFATTGAAQDSRLTAIEAFTGSLDDTFATEAELNSATASLSASAHTDRIAKIAILSASVDAHLDANISALSASTDSHLDSELALLSASAHSQRVSEDTVLSGSAHTDRVAKVSVLSGSAHTDRVAKVNVLSGSAHTARRNEISDLSGSAHTDRIAKIAILSASVDTHLDANISALSASVDTHLDANISTLSASSAAALADQGSDVTDLAASQSAFDQAINLSGTNVTIVGNLEVSGTTTTVDSTTVVFADNIIALNGTGAANGGIEVDDANGPASGSLLWDGVNNRWIAGGKGSETAVFTSGGDHSLVSGSAQVTISSTTGYSTYSSSVQTYTDAKVAALSASADTHLDANISSISASAHAQRVSEDSVLSGSAHTDRIAKVSVLSGSAHTDRVAKVNVLSGSAHTQRLAISSSLATSIAGVQAGALVSGSYQVELLSDTGSLNFTDGLQIGDIYSQGNGTTDIYVPSGAAWVELNYGGQDFVYLDGRKAGIQIENDGTTLEWTFYGQGANAGVLNAPGDIIIPSNNQFNGGKVVVNTVTGSANFATLANLPTLLSGSGQVVDSLLNQDVDLGTGDITGVSASFDFITASAFSGDGSGLSNLTVTQNATVDDTFTSVTSYTVTHNFNSRNVIVQVYDTNDEMVIPSGVDTSDVNTAVITFDESFSGRAVVARGGHIVSGSIPFANLLAVPTLVSGSGQVTVQDTDGFTELQANISASFAVSSSAHTQREAVVSALSASAHSQRVSEDTVLSGSAHTQREAVISVLSGSAHTARRDEISDLSGSAHTARATLASSLTISGSTGNDIVNLKTDDLSIVGTSNEIETTVTNNQIQIGLPNDVTIGGALTVTGDLTVTGNTTEQQVTNLNVEDQFILINSGGVAQDAGFVVNGQGAAFGWDESENRFALDFSGATWDQTAITSDAYVAAVVTSDDANYQKVGNIRIDSDDIYIYV